jgi:hypothetical protein
MNDSARMPATCGVAFKEWSGVCDALAAGRQSVILRKGGIAEGPAGFVPEHRAFWLYPTHLHEAQQGLREERRPSVPPRAGPDCVPLEALALVEGVWLIERPAVLDAIADLHVWTAETLLRRFQYRRPGLWAFGVRVYRRDQPWIIIPTPEMLGCKSWVILNPPLATSGLEPVLADHDAAGRLDRLRRALEASATLSSEARA